MVGEVALIVADSVAERNEVALGADHEILLFLGRGVRPSHDIAGQHLSRHRSLGRPGIVVGRTDVDVTASGLAAKLEAHTRFDLLRDRQWANSLTYADLTAENISIARQAFVRLGGFDATLSAEGAVRELGLRALAAEVPIAYEPSAIATERLSFTTAFGVDKARRTGAEDARIADLHQIVPAGLSGSGRPHARGGMLPMRPALLVSGVLEHFGLRRAWLGAYSRLAAGAYHSGWKAAPRGVSRPPRDVDLAEDGPLDAPASPTPLVALSIGGTVAGHVRPPGGRWSIGLAEAAIDALDPKAARELDRIAHPWRPVDSVHLDDVVAVVGPAHDALSDEQEAELTNAGTRVERLAGPRRRHWDLVADCVAGAPEPIVALPLPGAGGDARWLRTAVVPLRAPNVAAVVGTGLRDGVMPEATRLASRHLHQGLYLDVGRAPQFLVLSTRMTAELRRAGSEHGRLRAPWSCPRPGAQGNARRNGRRVSGDTGHRPARHGVLGRLAARVPARVRPRRPAHPRGPGTGRSVRRLAARRPSRSASGRMAVAGPPIRATQPPLRDRIGNRSGMWRCVGADKSPAMATAQAGSSRTSLPGQRYASATLIRSSRYLVMRLAASTFLAALALAAPAAAAPWSAPAPIPGAVDSFPLLATSSTGPKAVYWQQSLVPADPSDLRARPPT